MRGGIRRRGKRFVHQRFGTPHRALDVCHISPEQIEDLARELKIDARRQWKLTREFLELHNKAPLAKLVEEWDHAGLTARARSVAKRGELIETIMQLPDGVKRPRKLLELKPVRLI